ncbi:MAG: radical SAM protein [Proteobacteria bacterium]|nr:radical SAM protein [Pseudomonadota bacterium]
MKKFIVILARPAHYDDDGYPITWKKAIIPSNSIAVLYGLIQDCAARKILGDDVEIQIDIIDEANRRIDPKRIAKRLKRANTRGMVAFAGVQSNQFPRTLELADKLVAMDIPVCIGGFHVSGYQATMGALPDEALEAQKRGISFFTGESENERLPEVLRDAYNGQLKPHYDYLGQMVDLQNEPHPLLPYEELHRTTGSYAAFDLGRGCPFKCSFCTIINVHGHKSRFRTVEDLEKIIRANHALGTDRYFITDDNVARNKNWEALFDKLAALRKEGIPIRILAQVDTGSYRIPGFIAKAVAAGVDQIFVGMESINEANLAAVNKKQNKVSEYQEALRAWKKYPVVITAAYIVGLPADTRETVIRDVTRIKKELPIDTIYFSNLTPLPGSVDHREMVKAGQWMDDDLNLYDTHHCVVEHPLMSKDEWMRANKEAWRTFYTWDHMVTVLRRLVASRSNKRRTTIYRLALYSWFGCDTPIHPIDGGIWRKRCRTDRRPGMSLENPLVFYPRHFVHNVRDTLSIVRRYNKLWRAYKKIRRDPASLQYTDEALGQRTENPAKA